VSVLRAAALEGLHRAVRQRRLVVSGDPDELKAARRRGQLVIDARNVAALLLTAERGLFVDGTGRADG
jgi:hypothetical protein